MSSKISTAVPLKPSNTIFGAQLNKKSSNTHLNKEKLGTSRPQKTFKWIKGRGFQTEREESESDKDSNVEHVFDKSDIPKTLVDINSLGSVNVTDTTVPSSYPLKYVYMYIHVQWYICGKGTRAQPLYNGHYLQLQLLVLS